MGRRHEVVQSFCSQELAGLWADWVYCYLTINYPFGITDASPEAAVLNDGGVGKFSDFEIAAPAFSSSAVKGDASLVSDLLRLAALAFMSASIAGVTTRSHSPLSFILNDGAMSFNPTGLTDPATIFGMPPDAASDPIDSFSANDFLSSADNADSPGVLDIVACEIFANSPSTLPNAVLRSPLTDTAILCSFASSGNS